MKQRRLVRVLLILVGLAAIALAQPAKRGGKTAVEDQAIPSRSWFGELSGAYAPVSESAARTFLAFNASRFQIDASLDGLTLASSSQSPLGRSFVFLQSYQGIPVYGAEVKVHFNRDGKVVAVNSSFVSGIRLETFTPSLSNGQAHQLLRDRMGPGHNDDAETPNTSRLVVYATPSSLSLAWEVVRHTDSGGAWKALVDATTGKMLSEPRDVNRYATGSGKVFRVNAIVATHDNSLRDNNDAASAVPAAAYSTVSLLGLAGNGYLDGPFASSSKTKKRAFNSGNLFLFDRSNDGFSETMGYYYLDYAQRYIQGLGFSNVNNRRQVFSVNRYRGDNSFYSPSTGEITLGLGGVDDAEDADVILHEYGHSIQDNQTPGFGSSLEAGSMGEGFGDYWAGSVGAQFSNGFQDTCLAEWDATSYSSTTPPCLRRLDGTKMYPADIVGEVHDDGEIWSAALWQIRGTIGATNADRAILQHHFLIPRDSSFNTAANALVTAAIGLGFTPPQVDAIRTILRARGFTVTV